MVDYGLHVNEILSNKNLDLVEDFSSEKEEH